MCRVAASVGVSGPFALALVLDELVRHVRDLDAGLRAQVLAGARMLLTQR